MFDLLKDNGRLILWNENFDEFLFYAHNSRGSQRQALIRPFQPPPSIHPPNQPSGRREQFWQRQPGQIRWFHQALNVLRESGCNKYTHNSLCAIFRSQRSGRNKNIAFRPAAPCFFSKTERKRARVESTRQPLLFAAVCGGGSTLWVAASFLFWGDVVASESGSTLFFYPEHSTPRHLSKRAMERGESGAVIHPPCTWSLILLLIH